MAETVQATHPTPRPRWRRWFKALAISVLTLVVLLAIGVWIMTRSWALTKILEPHLSERFGGEVLIDDASISTSGVVTMRGVTLRASELQGEAGTIGQFDELIVTLDSDQLKSGNILVTHINVEGGHVRVSESASDPGVYNVDFLDPPASTGDSSVPPSIGIQSLVLETGTHDNNSFTPSQSRQFAGEAHLTADDEHWYSFHLTETMAADSSLAIDGLILKGQWDTETNTLLCRIDSLHLDTQTRALCPEVVRRWWDHMKLEGIVKEATLHYRPGEPVETRLVVEDVLLTLPIETKGLWGRIVEGQIVATPARPRLRVHHGIMRLAHDEMKLEGLRGEFGSRDEDPTIVPVPYRLDLNVDVPTTLKWSDRTAWFQNAFKTAAFEMDFHIDGFQVNEAMEGPRQAVDLPLVVAQSLERFHMTGWHLSTNVQVSRAHPAKDEQNEPVARPIEVSGQAYIKNARCQYDGFRYPLHHVDAFVEFTKDTARIDYITGQGEAGTSFRMNGEIHPLTEDPGVSLHIVAYDLPLDHVIRAALNEGNKKVYDLLFSNDHAERLEGAGLLEDEHFSSMLNERIEQVRNTLRNDDSLSDEDRLLAQQEMARLHSVQSAGPFRVGGTVDLELDVVRKPGKDQTTVTTGLIKPQNVGLLFQHFPYPITITDGVVQWMEDGVVTASEGAHSGVRIITPNGGGGFIEGGVSFRRDGGEFTAHPDLTVSVQHDRPSDLLFAAIPPGADETRSPDSPFTKQAATLRKLGIDGPMHFTGRVLDDSAAVPYSFAVELEEANIQPVEAIDVLVGETGLIWPEEIAIGAVQAKITIEPDSISLDSLLAQHGTGTLTGEGLVSFAEEMHTDLTFNFHDLSLESYLVDLFPKGTVDQARIWWERLRPSGTFDAALTFASDQNDGSVRMTLTPDVIDMTLDEQLISFSTRDGMIVVEDDVITFQDLLVGISGPQGDDGLMALNGSYGMSGEDTGFRLNGYWNDGHFVSPLITEVLKTFKSEDALALFERHNPRGHFHSDFSFQSHRNTDGGGEGNGTFEVNIRPTHLHFDYEGQPISLMLQDGASIRITPQLVEFSRFGGDLGGDDFDLTGSWTHSPSATVFDANLQFTGSIENQQLHAFLPDGFNDTLAQLSWKEGKATRIVDGHVVVTNSSDSNAPSIAFDGTVVIEDTSFDFGLEATKVNGPIGVHVRHEGTEDDVFTLSPRLKKAHVKGHAITDLNATIQVDPDGICRVADLSGGLYGGLVTASAIANLNRDQDEQYYRFDVQLVDVGFRRFLRKAIPSDEGNENSQKDTDRSTRLFADLSIRGTPSRRELTRSGRGMVRVHGGDLGAMPGGARFLQALTLLPPVGGAWNYLDVDFYVENDRLQLEEIELASSTLRLEGSGLYLLDEEELDVLLRSRTAAPSLDQILKDIRDRLFQVRIHGPIDDLKSTIVPLPDILLPGTRSGR